MGECREADGKGGALARPGAFGGHGPAVQLGEPPYERQADSQSAVLPVYCGVRLVEEFEQPGQVLRPDPGTVVRDSQDGLVTQAVDLDADPTARTGVRNGVDEKVRHDLLDAR